MESTVRVVLRFDASRTRERQGTQELKGQEKLERWCGGDVVEWLEVSDVLVLAFLQNTQVRVRSTRGQGAEYTGRDRHITSRAGNILYTHFASVRFS